METSSNLATSTASNELVITRLFEAPRSVVFKAWTQPEHMMRWWGPKSYTTPSCEMDVRPGGALRLCMRSSEGKDLWVGGVFREVVEPERLVFTATDEEDPGAETVISVTLEDRQGKTLLTMHQTFARRETARGAKEGWTSSLERLTELLGALQ
jgi:uncharacterized protein YndB with AHSA1/START domain